VTDKSENLKKWIVDNMTSDNLNELDVHKERVSRIMTFTRDGKTVVKIDRKNLNLKSEVLIQLIGRAYANAAGISTSDDMSNEEISSHIRGTEGAHRKALTELRKTGLIEQTGRGRHRVVYGKIGYALELVDKGTSSE